MTCSELSAHTLVTKGTLTGVLDRLVAKGLIRRDPMKGRPPLHQDLVNGERRCASFEIHLQPTSPFFGHSLNGP